MLDKKKVAREAAGIIREANDLYWYVLQKDYREYITTIKPGETVEEMGRFKSKKNKESFNQAIDGLREKLGSVIDDARSDMLDEIAEAPKPDALNYINALGARAVVTQDEIDAAVNAYGDNWTCYQMIGEIAEKHRRAGRRISFPYSNTLDGAEKFISDIEGIAGRELSDIRFEAREERGDREAHADFASAQIEAIADGSGDAGSVLAELF